MAFLSLLDNRAKPKGSRDPLGFEMVWSHYGRQVIGNLTTITSSLTNFAVALLGFQWANDLHRHLPEFARQALVRDTFLRYEQLAGYLRYMADDRGVMGITRVARRIHDPSIRISFGLGAEEQILSDQASYGLWGLYSAAMRDTGLVRGDSRDPTGLGRTIADDINARLDSEAMINLFSSKRKFKREDLKPFSRPFEAAIGQEPMRERLLHSLMNGSDNQLLQQEMWRVTQVLMKSRTRIGSVADFIDKVKGRTKQPELKQRLNDIEQVERLLVAVNNIFHYCRRKDGDNIRAVLGSLSHYRYDHLPNEMDFHEVPHADSLNRILKALKANKTLDALKETLELNRVVMEQRGGAPWVEIEAGESLLVRVPSETAELRDQLYLEQGWDYDYFLGSFISISIEGLGALWTLR